MKIADEELPITARDYYEADDEDNYPLRIYRTLPEFIVDKLKLNRIILNDLPLINNRDRESIYNWMLAQNFTQEDLEWVGW